MPFRTLDAVVSKMKRTKLWRALEKDRLARHREKAQLAEAVEPLKTLRPVFEQVVKDHEQRITALKQARQ
jgi:hypothetical protein